MDAAANGKKAHLGMKRHRKMQNSIQTLAVIELHLSEGIM